MMHFKLKTIFSNRIFFLSQSRWYTAKICYLYLPARCYSLCVSCSYFYKKEKVTWPSRIFDSKVIPLQFTFTDHPRYFTFSYIAKPTKHYPFIFSAICTFLLVTITDTSFSRIWSVGSGSRLHLCWGAILPPNKFLEYDTEQSDSEAPVMLELWGMWSSPSFHGPQIQSGL